MKSSIRQKTSPSDCSVKQVWGNDLFLISKSNIILCNLYQTKIQEWWGFQFFYLLISFNSWFITLKRLCFIKMKNDHKFVQPKSFILVKMLIFLLVTFITYEFWTLTDRRKHQFFHRTQSHAYTISDANPQCIPSPINYHSFQIHFYHKYYSRLS